MRRLWGNSTELRERQPRPRAVNMVCFCLGRPACQPHLTHCIHARPNYRRQGKPLTPTSGANSRTARGGNAQSRTDATTRGHGDVRSLRRRTRTDLPRHSVFPGPLPFSFWLVRQMGRAGRHGRAACRLRLHPHRRGAHGRTSQGRPSDSRVSSLAGRPRREGGVRDGVGRGGVARGRNRLIRPPSSPPCDACASRRAAVCLLEGPGSRRPRSRQFLAAWARKRNGPIGA